MITTFDVVGALADAMPTQRFEMVFYTPRSGAVQRARDAGQPLAPVLLDVSPDAPAGLVQGCYMREFLARLELDPGQVVALGSRLLLGAQHLLLLDFAIPCSTQAQDELVGYLQECGWRGWLLESGASYHFIGATPMDPPAWRREMARALLIPGIDVRYMGHSLHREQGAVRLTACPLKPTVPFVVAVLS